MAQYESGQYSHSPARVLAVTPFEEDLMSLQRILGASDCELQQVHTCAEAVAVLRQNPDAVVICERELPDGNWRDLLHTAPSAEPPHLIVATRHPDEYFWSEVLELGGYDVLAKPFRNEDVLRTVRLAWGGSVRRAGTATGRVRTAL